MTADDGGVQKDRKRTACASCRPATATLQPRDDAGAWETSMTNEDQEAAVRGLREVLGFAGAKVVEEAATLARALPPEDVDLHVYAAQVAEIARQVMTRHAADERAALAALKAANARMAAILDAMVRPTAGVH